MPRRRKPAATRPAAPRSAPGANNPPQPNADPTQLELLQDFVRRGQRAQAAVDRELQRGARELDAYMARGLEGFYDERTTQELEDAERERRRPRGGP